ncbi:hypothetical protein D3Y57_19330 [Sphingomonas paeninsulae]|uniref:Minor tail protein n=1 Tax=Sphingomonas paeninsulae TaxID=2319844 RepID=A0A494TPE7_SPHPE|nr:hypothetical protein [Sphingomonas paeninsulae]AYJ87686.1 hypothetical protein D3Y57_19330 [Sphingomonas paeninsulae]
MTTTFQRQADGIPVILKAPSATLDYLEDWTAWLSALETITAITVSIDTEGLTMTPAPTWTGGIVTVWLSGGALMVGYVVSVQITTSQGRIDTRSFRVRCVQR